jgi:superfamily II DNA/RNA helicase
MSGYTVLWTEKPGGVDNDVCSCFRLDVESKLPEQLKLAFICCRSEDKSAALLCLLKHVIKPESMTVVFAATKHHVEYLHMVRYSTTLWFMKENKLYHPAG